MIGWWRRPLPPPPPPTPAPASDLSPVLVPDRSAWLTMRWCARCEVGWQDATARWSWCWCCGLTHDAEADTPVAPVEAASL